MDNLSLPQKRHPRVDGIHCNISLAFHFFTESYLILLEESVWLMKCKKQLTFDTRPRFLYISGYLLTAISPLVTIWEDDVAFWFFELIAGYRGATPRLISLRNQYIATINLRFLKVFPSSVICLQHIVKEFLCVTRLDIWTLDWIDF